MLHTKPDWMRLKKLRYRDMMSYVATVFVQYVTPTVIVEFAFVIFWYCLSMVTWPA